MNQTETASLMRQWFEEAPVARILVAADLTVLSANAAAEQILREGDALVLRNGMLAATDREAQVNFTILGSSAGRGRPVVLPSATQMSPLVVQAQALQDGLLALELWRARPPQDGQVPDLSQVFKLTRGEKALVRPLLEGKGNEVIARELGLSVETVRSHLKNACAKMGVSGRAEFVAKLIQFLPSFA
jgi:DNA-binding CsgD family transcriptional regulator